MAARALIYFALFHYFWQMLPQFSPLPSLVCFALFFFSPSSLFILSSLPLRIAAVSGWYYVSLMHFY